MGEEEAYQPPPEFKEDVKEPLFDINSSESTEFWLIQWPKNRNSDFDGQEVTLKLHRDGVLGSFNSASGKEYEVVSFASPDPNATVFVSSATGTKIAGKISRRVSLVHYSEPEELQQLNSTNLAKMYQQSSATSHANSSRKSLTPQSSWKRNPRPSSANSASRHKSHNSSLSEAGEPSESALKRKNGAEPSGSAHNSGRGHSGVTSSESIGRSHQGKSQKKKKTAD